MLDLRAACGVLLLTLAAPRAHAAPPAVTRRAPASWLVEGRLLLARPAALETGMSAGIELGFLRGAGLLSWGARASWSAATESTNASTVRHDELRLRAAGALLWRLGRGRVGLRLGLGATTVHEDRELSQAGRAGVAGAASSAWRLLPAAELEGVVTLRIFRDFGVSLSGGPSLHIGERGAVLGWLGAVGVSWQP